MKTNQVVVVLVLIAVAVVLFFMNDANNKEGKDSRKHYDE